MKLQYKTKHNFNHSLHSSNKKIWKTRLSIGLALFVLLGTVTIWSYFGAKAQSNNADQLVNTYMLENSNTFRQAQFPGTHSFLIKWPFFYLIKLLGHSDIVFVLMTMLICLVSVSILAYIIYKIDQRYRVYVLLWLSLASTLLLVPAQPYAGGLLPVNMAMVTTRNIEYLVYILSLYMLIKAKKITDWHLIGGILLSSLLIASDKLFFTLSLGGSAMLIVTFCLLRKWSLVKRGVQWLVVSLLSALLAVLVINCINLTGITYISSANSASSYQLIHSLHQLILGLFFAVGGLLTNFGANPAYDALLVREIPRLAIHRLSVIGGLAFIINLLIFVVLLVVGIKFVWKRILFSNKKNDYASSEQLSLALIFISITSVFAFIFTDHYYAVDARYLSIVFFSLFIVCATYVRRTKITFTDKSFIILVTLLVTSVSFGMYYTIKNQTVATKPLNEYLRRDKLIASALKNRKADILLGDYWRVIPIKHISGNKQRVLPLGDCVNSRDVLTSKAWDIDLHDHSFAYLLSFDKSLTDFPSCNLNQIQEKFGLSNASVLISGTVEQPKEVLLYFDKGINNDKQINSQNNHNNTSPLQVATLNPLYCPEGKPTILNIVAHEDDDLLFLNPDLQKAIDAGDCIRSVYLTAGDAGLKRLYWLGREKGSMTAYQKLFNQNSDLIERPIKLADHQFISSATLINSTRLSLFYFRLPDGNINGQGFKSSGYHSLKSLNSGKIAHLDSVDNQSSYSDKQLVEALTSIMETYHPLEVRTQADQPEIAKIKDHSDHIAAGQYAQRAFNKYSAKATSQIKYYIGYPFILKPENIYDDDLKRKEEVFLTYSNYDDAVCHNHSDCAQKSNYGAFLKRQYKLK